MRGKVFSVQFSVTGTRIGQNGQRDFVLDNNTTLCIIVSQNDNKSKKAEFRNRNSGVGTGKISCFQSSVGGDSFGETPKGATGVRRALQSPNNLRPGVKWQADAPPATQRIKQRDNNLDKGMSG